jgi:hypothetical protein
MRSTGDGRWTAEPTDLPASGQLVSLFAVAPGDVYAPVTFVNASNMTVYAILHRVPN